MARALNFIGGKWFWPEGAQELTSLNPADQTDIICQFPDSPESEIDRAVQAARKVFPAWKRCPAPERAKIIRRAGEILGRRKAELGALVTRE